MFNDFCNSFQALQTFSSLINFVCVFNVSLHILFCRILFIVAINLELRFYQLRPYIYSFCPFFLALHSFFFGKFSMTSVFSRPYVFFLPMLILESRVEVRNLREQVKKQSLYSEKATKFCGIFPLLLTACTVVKSKGKILQNFVAFSEYMNFM